MRTLVAVDGSENAARAVEFVVAVSSQLKQPLSVCLLTVQSPIAGPNVKKYIGAGQLEEHYREQGMAALAPTRAILDKAGVPYDHHIGLGNPADVIVEYAKAQGVQHIVLGTRGLGHLGGLLMGSVATGVLETTPVPVTLVK